MTYFFGANQVNPKQIDKAAKSRSYYHLGYTIVKKIQRQHHRQYT